MKNTIIILSAAMLAFSASEVLAGVGSRATISAVTGSGGGGMSRAFSSAAATSGSSTSHATNSAAGGSYSYSRTAAVASSGSGMLSSTSSTLASSSSTFRHTPAVFDLGSNAATFQRTATHQSSKLVGSGTTNQLNHASRAAYQQGDSLNAASKSDARLQKQLEQRGFGIGSGATAEVNRIINTGNHQLSRNPAMTQIGHQFLDPASGRYVRLTRSGEIVQVGDGAMVKERGNAFQWASRGTAQK